MLINGLLRESVFGLVTWNRGNSWRYTVYIRIRGVAYPFGRIAMCPKHVETLYRASLHVYRWGAVVLQFLSGEFGDSGFADNNYFDFARVF